MGPARHQRDAEPGRHHVELVDPPRRTAAARRRRRGPAGAAQRAPRPGSACRPAAWSCRKAWYRSTVTRSRSVSYGALLGDKPFNVKFTGTAPQKPINRYKLVGTSVPRVDIPDKASGKYVHMQHVRLPDMLHGRVVRPRGQRAYGDGAKPVHIDESSIKDIPARIVRKGDFVGVVAEREWDAVKAAQQLKVTWRESTALPDNAGLFDHMRASKSTDTVIADWGDATKALRREPRTSRRRPTAARTSRMHRSAPTAHSPTSARTAQW